MALRARLRVVFAVRNPEAGERAADTIRHEIENADVTSELLDLADNAGVVMPLNREVTANGFELHFGTNHLCHFTLTAGLLPLLRASDAPRIVTVGSLAHRRAHIDFEDLQAERSYKRVRAYGQSKLANLLFMRELQRRSDLSGWGVISTGAHPGFARTEAILRPDDSIVKRALTQVMFGLVPTAESAARAIVHAATSPEVSSAGYYGPAGPGEIAGRVGSAKLAARAQDPALATRLWEISEALTAVTFAGS